MPKRNPELDGAAELSGKASAFRRALRAWFLRNRRDLPWRRDRSVYRTVVSEFMLQQTQVDTVIPYFENWTQRWGSFEELAKAEEGDVLRAWEGLGYYSRARNLLGVAKRVEEKKHVPASVKEWQDFRGIGSYTAAAIASIAQGIPAAVVDGNVVRILARLSGNATVFRDSVSAASAFSALADTLIDEAHPGDHNEAMMELGAVVCSRHSPQCLICPVRTFCSAYARGNAEVLPKFIPKKTKKVEIDRLWCRVGDEILLVRHHSGTRRLKEICEFPQAGDFSGGSEKSKKWNLILEGKRGIANEIITERFRAVPARSVTALERTFCGEQAELFRAKVSQLSALTFSGPHRKWLAELIRLT